MAKVEPKVLRRSSRRLSHSVVTSTLHSSYDNSMVLDVAASVREYSMNELNLLSEVNYIALARSLIETIKNSPRSEMRETLVEWCEVNFPAADDQRQNNNSGEIDYREFSVRLIGAIGMELLGLLKFARIGLFARLIVTTVLTYFDMITDLLMIRKYYIEGETSGFHWSLGIFLVSTFIQVCIAIAVNGRKTAKQQVFGVIQAVCLLNPVIHSAQMWLDKGNIETDSSYSAGMILMMTRLAEAGFESLPECVLQSTILMRSSGPVSKLAVLSILSSAASSAFIMTDMSCGQENRFMDEMIRGRASDKNLGILPDSNRSLVGFVFGHWIFNLGYMLSAVMVFAAVTASSEVWVFPVIVGAEYSMFMTIYASTNRLKMIMGPVSERSIKSEPCGYGYTLTLPLPPPPLPPDHFRTIGCCLTC